MCFSIATAYMIIYLCDKLATVTFEVLLYPDIYTGMIMLDPREMTVRENKGSVKVCPKAETVVCLSVNSMGKEAGMICISFTTLPLVNSNVSMQRKAVTMRL